jgi:hypothetical protein
MKWLIPQLLRRNGKKEFEASRQGMITVAGTNSMAIGSEEVCTRSANARNNKCKGIRGITEKGTLLRTMHLWRRLKVYFDWIMSMPASYA